MARAACVALGNIQGMPHTPLTGRFGNSMDIKSSKLLYLKGVLFIFIGILASTLLLIDHPSWRTAILLTLAVWGFARAYYFAFYVVNKYVDSQYRFAGLIDFVRYLIRSRK